MPPFPVVVAVRKIIKTFLGRKAVLLPRVGYAGLVKELEATGFTLPGWRVELILVSRNRVLVKGERC